MPSVLPRGCPSNAPWILVRCPSVNPGNLLRMDPVVVGGLLGIGGTAVGAVLQEGLVTWRARSAERRGRRRAVVAIVGELLDAVSILHKALERQAWWPEGDEPRQIEWQRHQEALVEVLDEETYQAIRMSYESLRSLAATRNEPLVDLTTIGPRNKLGRRQGLPPGMRWFWVGGRWLSAEEDVRGALQATATALELLRPTHMRLSRRKDQRARKRLAAPKDTAGA